jgi:plastocyanin
MRRPFVLKARVVLRSIHVGGLAALAVPLLPLGGCGDASSQCETAAQVSTMAPCGVGGAAGSGGSGMPITVNGCDSTMAIDKTNDPITMITFEGIEYTPRCVRVRAGSQVVLSGNFMSHPLVGGVVANGMNLPDPASPLPATNAGSEITVTLSKGGAVPYYCTAHAGSGMMGAIFVE